jgi:phosphohistidine phosphatase
MRVLFIRHAEAVEADDFDGPDLERPLTSRGRRIMKTAARVLADRYPKPAVIVSSCAERARGTADLVARAFGLTTFKESEMLNPGARPTDILRVLASVGRSATHVALVGHEPDFSTVISHLVADGHLRLKLKKGACVEVELIAPRRGLLRALADPALLAAS